MYKSIKTLVLIITLLGCSVQANSQVLMAILFGDKLNSDKLGFGLTLGNSFSNQTNIADAKWRTRGWNVGLFFNIKLTDKWYIHTGAIPKSTLGFRYLPTYKTGNISIDAVIDSFNNTTVERKVNYIHVPILSRFELFKMERKKGTNSFFIQGGPQISLRTKAKDVFTAEIDKNTLTFDNDLRDEIRRFDVSINAGLVWKFRKLVELSASYNQGFLDIDKSDVSGTNRNQFVMVNANIPIGGSKKKKEEAETIEKIEQTKTEKKQGKEEKKKGKD